MYIDTMLRATRPTALPVPDILESGSGSLVLLLHASNAGAHQWRSLIAELETRFWVRAVNLFKYGGTPVWNAGRNASLEDSAQLVLNAVPLGIEIGLIGHSLGGAVAMQVARTLRKRVRSLVLIEPSLFSLLRLNGRKEAFTEISQVTSVNVVEFAV